MLAGRRKTRVILPITDPYVVHHGALGSLPPSICPLALIRLKPPQNSAGSAASRVFWGEPLPQND